MLKEMLKNLLSRKKAVKVPASTARAELSTKDLAKTLDAAFKKSLRIRQVDAGSCNACEWECTALTNPVYDIQRFGIDFVASPRHADMLLVTGPVSRQMELALKKTYLATPEPVIVVACGDCALDGGIYKGSYAVTGGVSKVVPVDLYIPGCPPSPSDILSALLGLLESIPEKKP